MTDDSSGLRDRLLQASLPHVSFDGWSAAALRAGARDMGMEDGIVADIFPSGGRDLLTAFSRAVDRRMVETVAGADLIALRIHERVALAVEARFEVLSLHREAVRCGLSFLALPQNALLGTRLLYKTVDDIWYAIGDRPPDFSFYTKRGLLAGVVASTTLFWLDDDSEDRLATSAFIQRRLADVMKIQNARNCAETAGDRAISPLRIVREIIEKRYGRLAAGDSRVT
jgi:ubiquinone biosynthesis protein COQ9